MFYIDFSFNRLFNHPFHFSSQATENGFSFSSEILKLRFDKSLNPYTMKPFD